MKVIWREAVRDDCKRLFDCGPQDLRPCELHDRGCHEVAAAVVRAEREEISMGTQVVEGSEMARVFRHTNGCAMDVPAGPPEGGPHRCSGRLKAAPTYPHSLKAAPTYKAAVTIAVLLLFLASSASAEPQTLESGWELMADPAAAFTVTSLPSDGWRAVKVGLPWNAQFDDLRDYMGVAWYRVPFSIQEDLRARRVLLRFGAVDYAAEVFVNGQSVGRHEGAYTPFVLDATSYAKRGANQLVVRVIDPPPTARDRAARFPEMPYEELPRGKQNWYIQNGGLWQPVWVDVRPTLYVEAVRVIARVSGELTVETEVAGTPSKRAASLQITIRDADGKDVLRLPRQTASAPGVVRADGKIADPRLWSPASPSLYTVEAALGGPVADLVRDRFGFREFVARDGRFFLNGEPFYMIGALDQDFYPETITSTPGKPYLIDMMQKGRKLGLNLLRCHIKVCDPDYLAAADETGMLVWYEVPSWDKWTDRSVDRGRKIFDAMTLRDWNRPSIVIQSLINEAWGIDMTKPEQRQGLLAWFVDAKKRLAPLGRLLVDNSACCENFHLQTDIDDFHQYYSIPDNADRWDKWVADFASRPAWSFSSHGDARRTKAEPLVVSEFGNWGLPQLPEQLPWWFPRDFDGRPITRPAGLFDRFKARGFDRVFGDYANLAEETQWRQFFSLKHEIETMRRHGTIQGYVITEFTDINWEANGLMDMWRRPKAYAQALADIQQDDALLIQSSKRNVFAGESVQVVVQLSHFGKGDVSGSTLSWTSASGSSTGIISGGVHQVQQPVARGEVAEIARASLELGSEATQISEPLRERVSFTLKNAKGDVIARNTHDLYVFPRPAAAASDVRLHDPNAALAHLPWKAGMLDGKSTVVASVFDAQLRRHVESGGTALVVLSRVLGALVEATGLTLADRRGDLDGNWVSNFPWMHAESPAFRAAAVSRITGFEARAATPRVLIAGVPEASWRQGDVLSGMFFGWINENHATTAQFKVGKGKVVFTTFDTSGYGSDPFTTHLVNGLVTYVGSPDCTPTGTIP
jgi:hypothetical protein